MMRTDALASVFTACISSGLRMSIARNGSDYGAYQCADAAIRNRQNERVRHLRLGRLAPDDAKHQRIAPPVVPNVRSALGERHQTPASPSAEAASRFPHPAARCQIAWSVNEKLLDGWSYDAVMAKEHDIGGNVSPEGLYIGHKAITQRYHDDRRDEPCLL